MGDDSDPVATTPHLASPLKWAAWLAVTYAGILMLHAIVLQVLSIRVLISAGLFAMSGLGLLRAARWAWLLGLALSSLDLGVGAISFGLSLAFRTPWSDSHLPMRAAPVAALTAAVLVAFVVLLAHPRSRAAIRGGAV